MDHRIEDEIPFGAGDGLDLEVGHPLSSIVLQIEIMGVLGRWWR